MNTTKKPFALDSRRILTKKAVDTRGRIDEVLRKDPFINLWKTNYSKNFERGLLSNERTRPLSFLINTINKTNVPVVAIATGPSLDKNIDILKEYEHKCIIICADVALFKLIEHNIRPDFVVNVDPHESITRFWGSLDTTKHTLVCPTTTNPKSIESWKGRFFMYNQEDVPGSYKGVALKKLVKPTQGWGNIFNRYFIGATMTQFAYFFRPKPLMLMGYDFAFTDNKAYCDGFLDIKLYHDADPVGSEKHTKQIKKLKELEVNKEVEIYVSSAQPSVWTSKTLNMYKKSYVDFAKTMPFPIINATEGGILTELPMVPLKDALAEHCTENIGNKDFFNPPKRKRRKKRR